MPDPYEVDDDGKPVAEAESASEAEDAPEGAPEATLDDGPLRRQIDATLRFVALSTVVGVLVIAVLAAVLSDERGVLILVGIVYLLTSVAAYVVLRRNLMARLDRYGEGASSE